MSDTHPRPSARPRPQAPKAPKPPAAKPPAAKPRPAPSPSPTPAPAPKPSARARPAPAASPTPATEPAAASDRRGERRRGGAALRLLAVVAVVLIVADVLLYLTRPSASSGSDLQQAQADARSSAVSALPKLLSFDYKTIDSDIVTATNQLTGSFRTSYAKVLQRQLRPSVVKDKLVITASDVSVGVASGQTDRVSLLAFVTVTTRKGSFTQSLGSARLVTMTKVNDRWLVSAMSVA